MFFRRILLTLALIAYLAAMEGADNPVDIPVDAKYLPTELQTKYFHANQFTDLLAANGNDITSNGDILGKVGDLLFAHSLRIYSSNGSHALSLFKIFQRCSLQF